MATPFRAPVDKTPEGPGGEGEWFTDRSPVALGIQGRCPRCGRGRLFRSFLEIAPHCEACSLDYGFADAGDGPAVFVILIAGFVVMGLALWIEFTFNPPWWVHLLVSLPLLVVVCLGLLRPLKGVLVSLQFANRAAEGRLDQ
jgi:uncharacterized protein (DUF983 family)